MKNGSHKAHVADVSGECAVLFSSQPTLFYYMKQGLWCQIFNFLLSFYWMINDRRLQEIKVQSDQLKMTADSEKKTVHWQLLLAW